MAKVKIEKSEITERRIKTEMKIQAKTLKDINEREIEISDLICRIVLSNKEEECKKSLKEFKEELQNTRENRIKVYQSCVDTFIRLLALNMLHGIRLTVR